MTASVQSPEDVVNLALTRIGYRTRVVSMVDGSAAARAALGVYGQTRDELLRQSDWGFAERNVNLTLLKQAPDDGYIPPVTWTTDYPPLPWRFEYAYPDDCLKVRAIKRVPLFIPNFDPRPVVFALENDNSLVPPAKVILCNIEAATMVYTGRVTDPSTWEADYVEALAAALARRLAPALATAEAAKFEAADEAAAIGVAEKVQG